MKLPGKPWLWFVGVSSFVLLFIIQILPGIVRNAAVDRIERATGRKAAISRVALNPFTMSAEITGFRLAEKDGKSTFVSFSSARIKVSPASVTRRALIVSSLRVESPTVRLARTAANTYNFSDLVPKKKATKGKAFHFSINNIEIANGAVDFLDQAASKPTGHTVRRMDLSIPFVSNIPYLADIDVAPRFSAVVNGAPFSARGKFRPLEKAAETSVIVTLKDADLPFYAAYIPFKAPILPTSGKLTTTAEVTYRVSAGARPEITVTGALALRDLRVSARNGGPLLGLGLGTVIFNRMDLMARRFDLASVETSGLELFPERDERGVWIWRKLFPAEAAPGKPGESEKALPYLKVGLIRCKGGKVHFRDRLPAGGFASDVDSLELGVKNLSTVKGQAASLDLSLHTARGESIGVKGDLTLEPAAAKAQLELKGLDLAAYHPYLARRLASPIVGRLDAAAGIQFDQEAGLSLDGVTLAGHGLSADFGNKEGFNLAEVAVEDGKVNLKEQSAVVGSVKLSGGDIRLSRQQGGQLSFERLIVKQKGAKRAPAAKGPPATPFAYLVKRVEGENLDITFTDRTREGNPAFPLRKLRFSLQDVTGPKAGRIPFTLAAAYGKRGNIEVKGDVLPVPLKLKGSADLKGIPLRDFDAYLPDDLAVSMAGGAVDSRLNFDISRASGKLAGSFGGSLGIRSFYCIDTRENEDLLKWDRLQLNAIKGSLSPLSLSIGDISLSNYYSRIVITKNGTLNLQNLMEEKAGVPSSAQPGQTPQTAPPPAPSKDKLNIRIGTVTLQGGTMVFSDHHLPTPFTTTFHNLGGRIGALTSEESKAAQVDLRGNLENRSPLAITGSVNPLRKDLFVDLTIDFSDIDLTPATPYTGTYLGYAVDRGKLSLKLKYHIENKELKSENKIFFDQFTFGSKVESDKATNLPVRLAVALLKDRKGEIHLDLPVTGRTDDPKFSIWGLVFKVLKNLLVKAATSPFALLQAAFGGKEDFSVVTFSPGSTDIPPQEREKLMNLAQAIQDRPELNVEVTGYVDREKDPEGYRRELLAKKMRAEKFLVLVKEKRNAPDQTPETTEIRPEEHSTYLKAVYRKEKFPKPRTLIGTQKDLPDDEMKKLIFAHTAVGDAELRELARQRAAAVHAFLVEEGKAEKERVFLKSGDIFKAPEGGKSGSRVEFGALVK